MVFGGFVTPMQSHIKFNAKIVCVLFCMAFCRRRWFWFWIALGYPFATDKKQKWICFRLCFWSVGWFSFPFINLCTSHSFICCCCCCKCASVRTVLLFSLSLFFVSFHPHLSAQFWLQHVLSGLALYIIVIQHFWFPSPIISISVSLSLSAVFLLIYSIHFAL